LEERAPLELARLCRCASLRRLWSISETYSAFFGMGESMEPTDRNVQLALKVYGVIVGTVVGFGTRRRHPPDGLSAPRRQGTQIDLLSPWRSIQTKPPRKS
jgi:hypothetical protein